jgi:hypothetical protein
LKTTGLRRRHPWWPEFQVLASLYRTIPMNGGGPGGGGGGRPVMLDLHLAVVVVCGYHNGPAYGGAVS